MMMISYKPRSWLRGFKCKHVWWSAMVPFQEQTAPTTSSCLPHSIFQSRTPLLRYELITRPDLFSVTSQSNSSSFTNDCQIMDRSYANSGCVISMSLGFGVWNWSQVYGNHRCRIMLGSMCMRRTSRAPLKVHEQTRELDPSRVRSENSDHHVHR